MFGRISVRHTKESHRAYKYLKLNTIGGFDLTRFILGALIRRAKKLGWQDA